MYDIDRENFKYFAAGKFSYGKPTIDSKQIEIYVEGAIMAFDLLRREYGRTAEQEKATKQIRTKCDKPNEECLGEVFI